MRAHGTATPGGARRRSGLLTHGARRLTSWSRRAPLGGSAVVSPAESDAAESDPVHSDLVDAARGRPVRRTPVWFMRQAGRSLPEYRALRAGTAMLDACREPDLITEITLQPV